jgi:nucleoid DNA-binding protein
LRTKRTKAFLDEIAKEEGLRAGQVQEVTESFFRFVAQVMSEGNRTLMDFSNIRVMKWGVFKVKEGRRKYFEKINKRNKRADKRV